MKINEKLIKDYFYYKSGDSFEFHYKGGGYITGGSTSVNFTVWTSKSLDKVSNITLTGNLQLRQNNNYILPYTSLTNEAFTINIVKKSYSIAFDIVHNTPYTNAQNNSATGVECVGTITFS